MNNELARAVAVDKRFGELVAVRDASCRFYAGAIHAVCGENGAGKSTLLKIVAGVLEPDGGHVDAFGSILAPHTPREAIRRGIGMVQQHFALVPVFTALENIVLGAEPTAPFGVIDLATARVRAEAIARELGVTLPLDARVESLGIGDRQRLEVARALFRDAKLLLLDEPTAVLTKTEAIALYQTLGRLAAAGKGIVVVTHKMDEVRAYADVVTVMRRGRVVFTREVDRSGDVCGQVDEVAAAIMGAAKGAPASHADGLLPRRTERESGNVVLHVDGVVLPPALNGVTFAIREGEIVGIAGVEGNGQRELVSVMAGDAAPSAGEVSGARVAVVREDRQQEGLVLDATLRDNLVLGELGSFAAPLGLLNLPTIEREAASRLERSGVHADLDRTARTLSGGNQQKLVVARALARLGQTETSARVLVAAHPTRGVDLGATKEIHTSLRRAAAEGAGVLVLSADLDELRALCSRILVLSRGRIVADVAPSTSDEDLGRWMLGVIDDRGMGGGP